MAPIHIVLLLFFDCYMYEFEIPAIVFDLIMLWCNYYNYMTLFKLTCGIEAGLYVLGAFISITHINRVFFDTDSWAVMFLFFI